MERCLIDTDIIIDHLRGEEKARDFLRQTKSEETDILYSVITKAELYSGVRQKEEEKVSYLLRSMEEVRIDGEIAIHAGRYRNKFYASHGLLLPDALIAASAKKVGATLVTLNKKHYPMQDIKIQVPYHKR
ncbi:MAG: type II toxin-antitoxin system VapC family toxin [Thermodesulfobacteriota bacterium]|nr:type II toxin-antitoxin system VapC family toxin [Thermodesulfobacteriota bacterium]